ncbi:AAA family ATPase [Streptosporangium sp. NPDC051023]|uniref:helix-turn-helix transcriptional regulator n=1 Tax=Streptosporangium sp. NPDC051023 TaxID=3155410 RepID=UPI00344D4701
MSRSSALSGVTAGAVPSALIGRGTELRALLVAITNPPSVTLVEGAAGIGKTRLVTTAVNHLRRAGRTVLVGRCQQIRAPFPYGPILDALRHLANSLPARQHLSPVTGVLRGHLPELAGGLPPAAALLEDPRAERHRLFRAVHALLTAAPAVMVVEDLHWADEDTRDLLYFLSGQMPRGLSLVATFRRHDLPVPGLPLGRAYRRSPGTASETISLTPLDVDGVRALARALLGRDITASFAAKLLGCTSGIPFVIEEVLRTLPDVQQEEEELEEVDRMPVPLLIREAIAERLSGMSALGLRVTHAVAVLRSPADEPLITAVCGQTSDTDDDKTAAGLREALEADVLGEHEGHYGFRYALACQAVYDTISGPDRRLAHLRALAALTRADSSSPAELAFHARHGGDLEAWQRYGSAAADHAMALSDIPQAVEILGDLLADPKLPRSGRDALIVRLSGLALSGLSHQRVIRLLRRLLSDPLLPRDVRGEVRLNLGQLLCNHAGVIAAGRQEIISALADLSDRPATAIRALALLMTPTWGEEPLSRHVEWAEQAERLLVSCRDRELAATVRANRIAFAVSVGSPELFTLAEALPTDDSSATIRRHTAFTYAALYDGAITLGHYLAARRFGEKGRRIAEETGALYAAHLMEVTSTRLDWLTGHWDGLRKRAAAIVEGSRETPLLTLDARLVLGLLALATGEWQEAEDHLYATGPHDPASAFQPLLATASAGLINLHLARGSVEAAVGEAGQAVERLRRKAVWVWGEHLVPSAVAALLKAERTDEATGLVAEFAAGIAGRSAPSAEVGLGLAHAMLAHAEGRYAASADLFAETRAAQEAMPQPYGAARSMEAEAEARLNLGDHVAATQILTSAAERFARLGATHDAARCRSTLRTIGAGILLPKGKRGKEGALSPRESEVARLVALGRTNAEIAEVLFLSPRTVEAHVAKVLRKVGVRSRTEVALHDEE